MKVGKHYKSKGYYRETIGNIHYFDAGNSTTHCEQTTVSFLLKNKSMLLSIALAGIGALISLFAIVLHFL